MYKKNEGFIEHAYSKDQIHMNSSKIRLVLKGPSSTFFFHIDYDLFQYDIKQDTFMLCSQEELPEKEYFHYGLTDNAGTFWIISETGLYTVNTNRTMLRVKDIDHYCSVSDQVGSSIVNASDTTIYVSFDWWGVAEISTKTKKVISVLRKTKTQLTELNSNQNYSLYQSPDNELWWCSDGAYLITKENSGRQFIQSGSSPETENYAILSITEDSKGTIWIGTDGGGLHTYSISQNKTTPTRSIASLA